MEKNHITISNLTSPQSQHNVPEHRHGHESILQLIIESTRGQTLNCEKIEKQIASIHSSRSDPILPILHFEILPLALPNDPLLLSLEMVFGILLF